MLQRIQSIWLLLAASCSFAGLKYAFFAGTVTEQNVEIPLFVKLNAFHTIPLTILTISLAVLSLVAVFLYKNRRLQIRLCVAGILIELGVIYLYYREIKKFIEGTFALTAVLQLLVVVFLILAIAGIRKDNKIIAESERLR